MRVISASLMPLISRREQRIACGAAGAGLRPGRRSAWSGPVDSRILRAAERPARGRPGSGSSAAGPWASAGGGKGGEGREGEGGKLDREKSAAFVRGDGFSAFQCPDEALMSTGRTWTPDRRAS